MFFFHKKEKPARIEFDPSERTPAVRCSICTGERVAGFKNLRTGKFEDYELIRKPKFPSNTRAVAARSLGRKKQLPSRIAVIISLYCSVVRAVVFLFMASPFG